MYMHNHITLGLRSSINRTSNNIIQLYLSIICNLIPLLGSVLKTTSVGINNLYSLFSHLKQEIEHEIDCKFIHCFCYFSTGVPLSSRKS